MLKPDLSFVHKYFMAEKQAALMFLVIGSLAILLAAVAFFFIKNNTLLFKGAAIPFFMVGIIMAIIGMSIYQRSDKQRLDTSYKMGLEPYAFVKAEELPRMEKVIQSFKLIIYAEIFLVLVGVGLFFYFRNNSTQVFWKGFGLSLALISIIAAALDYNAEKRATDYKTEVAALIDQ